MKLQILIPQYKETEEEIRPLLDSLKVQQSVDFSDFGCIIVNDGSDVLLSNDFLESYPFEILYFRESHKGVSATRNACFNYSKADYVMFCDADDMFFNVCGLYIIFNEIENGGFDTFVSSFIEESRFDGKPMYIPHQTDMTFVHGKVHNRKFLINNNIRWNPNLTIHEDSYFNCLCQRLSINGKFCPNAFYLWKWRDNSVCRHDPKYILKTYNNMLDSSTALVNEFLDRQRKEDAEYFATNMIFDAYYTMNKQEWIAQENQEYRDAVEKRFKLYFEEFESLFNDIDDKVKSQIIMGQKNRMFGEGLFLESITFDDWIHSIMAR